jgi:hypothetical protein
LAAFVRALQAALGHDTCDYALAYVDDIVVHSKIFELHLQHLNIVLQKLTDARFTVNAEKCHFCRGEITFLGHVIREGGMVPCPKRIEAILSHPPPKIHRQLRQFLGITNYHQKFIVGYANNVAPLLTLLRKGILWKWTAELQRAVEVLRAKFADSIHLIHPNKRKFFTRYGLHLNMRRKETMSKKLTTVIQEIVGLQAKIDIMSWENNVSDHLNQEAVISDESAGSDQPGSVPQDKSISCIPLSDNANLHNGNDGFQEDSTRCKNKHAKNPDHEIEHSIRRKRRLPIRSEDFLWQ